VIEPYRWTLGEYVLRCEQGADLCEVLVESDIDRDVFGDALKRWRAEHVRVLASDYIEVSDDETRRAGFNLGVKGRLLTVATALESSVAIGGARVTIIVDRDYDDVLAPGDTLLTTDGHSLENYAFSAAALDRFARVVLGRGPLPAGAGNQPASHRVTCTGADLYRRVAPAATDIAAVRLTLLGLEEPPRVFKRWPDYVSASTDGVLSVNRRTLLRNVLDRAGRGNEYASLEPCLEVEAGRVTTDTFRLVRGHDFVSLLLKLLRTRWGRRVAGNRLISAQEGALARLLLVCVDPAHLDATPLFAELQRRFCRGAAP